MMKRYGLAAVLIAILLGISTGCGWLEPSPMEQVVYSNDFEGVIGPEWSVIRTDITPIGARRFLGQFGRETVSLTLTGLPLHTAVTVSFDLFIIRTWDGNGEFCCGPDVWDLNVDGGPTLLHTTFSNQNFAPYFQHQAYPDPYPGGDYPARTGAAEVNTLGYTYTYPEVGTRQADSVYRLSFTFPHSASSLRLNFSGFPNQDLSDESWGLDNILVRIERTIRLNSSASSFIQPVLGISVSDPLQNTRDSCQDCWYIANGFGNSCPVSYIDPSKFLRDRRILTGFKAKE